MKIMYITDALAVWGGIERVLSDKMNYLVDHGHDVYVVTSDQGGNPIPFALDERVQVYDLNVRFYQQYRYRGLKRLIKYFECERMFRTRLKSYIKVVSPDIISCIRDSNVYNVLKVKGDIPVIFESHALCKDIVFEKATFLHQKASHIGRKCFKKLDMIVTLTKGDANDWMRYCKNLRVIPNVVHLNTSGNYSRCTSKKVIFAGRFDVQKNIEALFKIWELVQQQYPDWELNVYGNGELKPFYESEVKTKGLNITIYPAVPDIFNKYRESSILILTSMYEPFGLVLVEAMSCGLPVVSFDCPYGPADIITDGVDGFLVENNNIDSFADRICQLIGNHELRKKMGEAGVLSSKRFCTELIMPLWIQLFEKLSTDKIDDNLNEIQDNINNLSI